MHASVVEVQSPQSVCMDILKVFLLLILKRTFGLSFISPYIFFIFSSSGEINYIRPLLCDS